MPLPGTNGVVPGSRKPLPHMGCGRDSVDRITRSLTKGDNLGGEHDAGFAMDRRKCKRNIGSRRHQRQNQYTL